MAKTAQLQVRVTREQKRAIDQAAQRAGMDMSAYVLDRVLGPQAARMDELFRRLANEKTRRYGYAELHDLLVSLTAPELQRALANPRFPSLPPEAANYVAAMVEQACAQRGIPVPAWIDSIAPLEQPIFGSRLGSLRLHLLANSPPAFKRRNIFIDTSIGGRV